MGVLWCLAIVLCVVCVIAAWRSVMRELPPAPPKTGPAVKRCPAIDTYDYCDCETCRA